MVYDINPMIYNQLGLISMAITVYRLSHFISWNQKIMMYSFHSGFRKIRQTRCWMLLPIPYHQWEFQYPEIKVLNYIMQYFVGIFPEI